MPLDEDIQAIEIKVIRKNKADNRSMPDDPEVLQRLASEMRLKAKQKNDVADLLERSASYISNSEEQKRRK